MDNSFGIDPHRPPDTQGYSSAVRTVLGFTALAVTLLPIPIVYFGIIPAYQRHAWFLLFYTPFLCLLTLCYLFYVRDSLARTIFADVLDPPPPPDPYYREPLGERLKRGFRRGKGIILGILPALLVLTSMYCVSRYFAVLDQSVALSIQTYTQRVGQTETASVATEPRASARRRRSVRPPAPQPPDSSRDSARDSLPPISDSNAVRSYVLRTSAIDDIPQLVELTALYVGAFVALLIAVTLMALKEYAKEALGLSEHELMFGRYHRAGTED
jgi:hypothetical protein